MKDMATSTIRTLRIHHNIYNVSTYSESLGIKILTFVGGRIKSYGR